MNSTLRQKLAKMGIRFDESLPDREVDVEEVLLEGTMEGRGDPRVFWGTLAWLTGYVDLVNISRLSNMLKTKGDAAALGAMCELAYEKNKNRKLLFVKEKCRPRESKEILFHRMAAMDVTRQDVVSNSLPVFSRWGFYCNYVNHMAGAVCNRREVLKRNLNLRLRALFGANSRADILIWLLGNRAAHARRIARELSLSYQPVYAELQKLAADKVLTTERIGNICVFSLTDIMKEWLTRSPKPA